MLTIRLGVPTLAQELRWRSGEALELPARRTPLAHAEIVRRFERAEDRHVLVLFQRSPTVRERGLYLAAGVELGRALGRGAFFARVSGDLDSLDLSRLPGIVDVCELEVRWKLHPTLLAGETPPWTVVARDAGGVETVAVYVLLHGGESLERGDQVLSALGGSVIDLLESVNGMVAVVPRPRVIELAAADPVAWLEPALPLLQEVSMAANDSNRALAQVDALQAAPYGLDGSGVNVMVYDAGAARAFHPDLTGRLTVRDGSQLSDHATHVSATIGGTGSASGGVFRGMAPGVTLQSYGFEWDGDGVFLFTNPGDFEADYGQAITVQGVDLANNSIGSNVENAFHCAIQGDYGVVCSLIDGVVRGTLGTPLPVVWAAGNERAGSRCDIEGFGDFYSLAPPATAKNHIAVGAVNSNDDSMTGFSSWGPTDDGRLKPDVCAPGCQVGGDYGVTSASDFLSYSVSCGTSMASPTVCGVAALILQDHRARFGGPDPKSATLKALLAHTAVDLGNAGPDYSYGYGSVRGQAAVDLLRSGQFLEDALEGTGACARWTLDVGPATPELRLTLAWDDAPAQPNVFASLVNDLDLVLLDPAGMQWHVWTLDPADPSAPAVRRAADRHNNIEQVWVESPPEGNWTVAVVGHDIPEGPQGFSLTASHPLAPVPQVRISFPIGLPAELEAGAATEITAHIRGVNDELIAGTPTLHLRYSGADFLSFPMLAQGGDLYGAELPPPVCTAIPEFYLSAQGSTSGLVTNPENAPAELHTALVSTVASVFCDDFENDLGWTVANLFLGDGAWERGTPSGGGTRGDPLTAYGGSGRCFVTDNVPGDSDVEGGPTQLCSPLFDFSSGGDFVVSYARWFTNDDYDSDSFVAEVSNNDATWTMVENVTNGGSGGGWVLRSFRLRDFVAPTGQVRFRFLVRDSENDSITEAGFDEFRIVRRDCTPGPDCNGNGILDIDDIQSGRSYDFNLNGVPDECGSRVKTRRKPN